MYYTFPICKTRLYFLSVMFQAALFEQGKDTLSDEFQSLLARHGRPVPPVIILDLIGTEEGNV